ncbi:hypothetical protein, partial [Pontitalea aquivivens]|uniref:hypothetical protein n=1 Tax=Pontitalea aquivivens TaxID=3388663 RepID=UPI0039711718
MDGEMLRTALAGKRKSSRRFPTEYDGACRQGLLSNIRLRNYGRSVIVGFLVSGFPSLWNLGQWPLKGNKQTRSSRIRLLV